MSTKFRDLHLDLPPDTPLDEIPFAVVDTETTASWAGGHLLEVGVVLFRGGRIEHEWGTLVNPYTSIQPEVTRVHGITYRDIQHAPPLNRVIPHLNARIRGRVLVAHNAPFDEGVLSISYARLNVVPPRLPFVDTLKLSRTLLALETNTLASVSEYFSLEPQRFHRALDDARTAAMILHHLLDLAREQGTTTLRELVSRFSTTTLGASISPFEPPSHLPELMLAIYTRARMEITYRSRAATYPMPVKFMTAFRFRDQNYVEVWHLRQKKLLTLRSERILKIRPLTW